MNNDITKFIVRDACRRFNKDNRSKDSATRGRTWSLIFVVFLAILFLLFAAWQAQGDELWGEKDPLKYDSCEHTTCHPSWDDQYWRKLNRDTMINHYNNQVHQYNREMSDYLWRQKQGTSYLNDTPPEMPTLPYYND